MPPDTTPAPADVDLLVIGGGVNGTGIARDAVGRGLSVLLCEKGDLAEGTSSRSSKLVHGGLRYLEHYEFRLVRESLLEREVLLAAAPHIIWPMRFVLPHSPEQRAAWLIRAGLFLYDHLGGRKRLPATRTLDLRRDPEGNSVRPAFSRAFEYSDCWVEDSRLVVLNAIDAAERGATVLIRTAFMGARREHGSWVAELADSRTGQQRTVRARALVNAAGPWVQQIFDQIAEASTRRRVRLVKGSHLIVRKFWEGRQAYLLQNIDKRVVFVIPYAGDLALIGTTDVPFEGEPESVEVEAGEVEYLLAVVTRYFDRPLAPIDVLHCYSGVRPLFDDGKGDPSAVTRDYVFELEGGDGKAPLLSAFGGKITTYRKLAEHALERLKPFFPAMGRAWTATAHLPGGDIPDADFKAFLTDVSQRYPWLPEPLALHYARLYGTRVGRVVGDAKRVGDLGRHFGSRLYEREARYLVEHEWAETAEDILERRTKHYLHMNDMQIAAFTEWLRQQSIPSREAARLMA
jgi:glycerol-3-phosphate dehydrogenase